jgi:DNA polymerase III subunit epsilon
MMAIRLRFTSSAIRLELGYSAARRRSEQKKGHCNGARTQRGTLVRCSAPRPTMAHALEATGNYKILRRLVPRSAEPRSATDRIGLIIDLETTGLDTTHCEVLEVAAIKFGYTDDRITSVVDTFQAFQQPSAPIEPAITALTGITDAMVEGHHVDSVALEQFVGDVQIIIAHNAGFDRKVAERHWPHFAHRHWACSAMGIDWKAHGLSGARLAYLLAESGLFHDAHRALDDCHAVLEILALNLPGTEQSGLAALLDRARRPQHRIWADGAPFALKDTLKQRGYRWNDGTDGRPKAWYFDADAVDAELDYLRKEIYRREDLDIVWRTITSLDRFSSRI